ncbi:MAG TPA: hypothetical protein VEX68_05480 [Bryobacteraceae bacterium]|nr:hypothetical protein [Bryobacteraceae bacterium]
MNITVSVLPNVLVRADLSICEREAIYIPGCVEPNGTPLVERKPVVKA